MPDIRLERSIGLLGATGIGVGAIVGGGILALAGVAFAATGPGAILAFALNGFIAVLTALSFAEMSSAFPESGGTYTFAKKVLSVRAAFMVGWVVWFASIAAAVLYAIGFGSYAVAGLGKVWQTAFGTIPGWLTASSTPAAFALAATALYTLSLTRKAAAGGQWATVGKIVVFSLILGGGVWALAHEPVRHLSETMSPFLPFGGLGLLQAMGYTFIALQGFDLIAAVAGEVRDPGRTIPRAMLLSLLTALAVYLPFLFIIATAGVHSGQSIAGMSTDSPGTVVAVAVENFMGPLGFWLVVLAAILSMLSGLYVNLFAASRIAHTMAHDRTLPSQLGRIHKTRRTPTIAVLASFGAVVLVVLLISDVAAAGAAASLIFLVSFALANGTGILARRRGGKRATTFRTPWFPLVQVAGACTCLALAIFQGIMVPAAGLLVGLWLGLGGIVYVGLLAKRARVFDASVQAQDPYLVQLRGRSPLVLVPIANPANAETMVAVANALAPARVGRVLLLSVVTGPEKWEPGEPPHSLLAAQDVLRESLTASLSSGLVPEMLTTVAPNPWSEIIRVAQTHRCESLLIGLSDLTEDTSGSHLEALMSGLRCDIVVLRAAKGWRLEGVRKVLVPVAGWGDHDVLRARLLGSLCRTGSREVVLLRVLPHGTVPPLERSAERGLKRIALDEVPGPAVTEVVQSHEVTTEITRRAMQSDLVILGLQRSGRRGKLFGDLTLQVARNTTCGIIMIGRGG
jgi:amino acid transporter/nucleotide-binding universal stress UspA family protein